MNPLFYTLLYAFLDDVVAVGTYKWGIGALICWVSAYGTFGSPPILFLDIAFILMAVNLTVFTIIAIWWDKIGREKYAMSSILDIAEQKGRDT